jgi:hypothetical protein
VSAVPYVGTQSLARLAARTMLVRAVLAIVLIALVLAAAASARRPRVDNPPILPPQSGGMVVLDLSASIASDTYARIHESLEQVVARGGRYGLVLFSNVAYEALPPGTPASALEPLTRYFALPTHVVQGEQPTYPVNPWSASFTKGTQISAGLDLARQIVLATKTRKPAVVLISDLADDPNDIQRLTVVLNEYKAAGIRLRVIALNAASSDMAYFANLIGTATAIVPAGLPGERPGATAGPRSSFPTWLVALTVGVCALLAANELRAARLRWGSGSLPAEVAG